MSDTDKLLHARDGKPCTRFIITDSHNMPKSGKEISP